MTWEIALIYALLVGALVSFALEKVPADVTALTLLATLILTGLLSPDEALAVFSNPAPLTVGAMFILSAALEKCGAIDVLARHLEHLARLPYAAFLAVMFLFVGSVSAFINNTPVVVVFMPVILSLARKMNVPASKLLIPLSYAAILGGCCTLVGTSTNILVSSIGEQAARKLGEAAASRPDLAPFGMFEISVIGLPVCAVGLLYMMLVGRRALPVRETLTSILSEEERREFITEAFVQPHSPHIGKTLKEAGLLNRRGIRVIEVVRSAVMLRSELATLRLQEGDRLVLACRPSGIAATKQLQGIDFVAEAGLEQIAAHEGLLVEGVIGATSSLIGRTIIEANVRQRFRVIIVAVHRRGKNLREKLSSLPLEFGDTLLMLGTQDAIANLRGSEDIILIDQPAVPTESRHHRMPWVVAAIGAAVAAAAIGWARIEIAAFIACVALFLIGAVRPKEGYAAIQWNILFLIFAMLGMGTAMETTGAARWLSESALALADTLVEPEMRPLVMLICVYAVTTTLTEVLSNNAAAAVMATIAIGLATTLDVSARPFLMAVAIAASASFATPIGYQTNTYVYGVGGYRFGDFLRIGVPLNILCGIVAIFAITHFFPF